MKKRLTIPMALIRIKRVVAKLMIALINLNMIQLIISMIR